MPPNSSLPSSPYLSILAHLLSTSYNNIKTKKKTPMKQDENCHIVQMEGTIYPFGEIKQNVGEEGQILVRKTLSYETEEELGMLQKMAGFLNQLDNQFVIGIHHMEAAQGQAHLFYEYVPLKLEKWLLDLGDDVVEQLEFEVLSLAQYLTQNGIKFSFNSCNLGLSKDIHIKYFLNQFAIDGDHKLANYKEIQQDIIAYFQDFKNGSLEDKNNGLYSDRKSADCAIYAASITTRESWGVKSSKSANEAKMMRTSLSQKVENSKKKSMEILARLKNLRSGK